ncbi:MULTISPECIES: hypothetical protein [unclassified Bacillus cereus group]|uniref:hypothetical protein n=1 Tax=unclassified Bacillus cereus group TaxID=2750818 RepID=UPI001F5744E7|nr:MULTISPECIES: hypothetical protein [unclassified Bacillus cereus group]
MKTTFKIILTLFVLSFVGVAVKVIFFPAHVANKAVDTTTGVIDKTLNTDNALTNYEQFKDGYNGAKAMVQNIKNAEKSLKDIESLYGEPNTWTKDIRSKHSFLQQNIDGYLMQYQSIVKDYNSNSSKVNRNLFKDKNLPSELPVDYKELK